MEKYELKLLTPAQRELEALALLHLQLSGPESARTVINRIYDVLETVQLFPQSGAPLRDRRLQMLGYRMAIARPYLAFYRLIGNSIYVYHIVDGRQDYPKLLLDLPDSQ